jgi:hypothetical protein
MFRRLSYTRARTAVGRYCSAHFHGAAPLGVQPDENSQRGNFHRSLTNKIEAPDTREVLGRHIDPPYYPARGDQTSEALFRGNADKSRPPALALRSLGGLGHGRIYRLLRQVKIGFASAIPAHISGLMIFGHCKHNDTRVSWAHVTEVWCNGLVGYPFLLGFKVIQPFQYSGGCPSGRVFHRRCTHSHWSGYFRT